MAQHDAFPDDAANVFDDYLRRREQGEAVDFAALCRAHPTLAPELRRHEATHRLIERLLPGPVDSEPIAMASTCVLGGADDSDLQADGVSELLGRLRRQSASGERYRVLAEIARGGMGIVLRVLDTDLRRKLAMKVARGKDRAADAGTPTDPKTIGRFLEEAQITSQLDHPGIPPVHEIGIDAGGHPFFTMRFVRGKTLREIFDRVASDDPEWPQVRAVGVLLKVCEAMSYAHDRRVIHRDLKPANVMVGQFGEVYVMDWGLARVLDRDDAHDIRIQPAQRDVASTVETERRRDGSSTPDSPLFTMDGQVLGTPAYMSPEQAKGQVEQVGPQADVYGVGAMLYHLIAEQMPYVPNGARLSGEAVRWRVVEGPPRSLLEFGRTAPPALVAICEKAIARVLTQRYADMRSLADDLRAYTEGRVVAAYETGSWAETRMWVRRNRGFAGMSLAAAVAFAVCVFFVVRRIESSEREQLQAAMHALARLGAAPQDPDRRAVTQESWRNDAKRLIALIPTVQAEIEELRDGVLCTPAHVQQVERAFLRGEEMDVKEKEVLWRKRMLDLEKWPEHDVLARVDARMASVATYEDIRAVNREVFSMVRPDDQRDAGDEPYAVLLADRMVKMAKILTRIEEVDNKDGEKQRREVTCYNPALRDTFAFACFRCGQFDRAIEEQWNAVKEAPEVSDFSGNLKILHYFRRVWQDRGRQLRLLDRLEADVAMLQLERDALSWGMAMEPAAATWHDEVAKLLVGLRRLEAQLRATDRARAELSWADKWNRAIDEMRANPRYSALGEIVPQDELLPLRENPESHLWEFAHLPSGEPQSEESPYPMEPDAGLVFVLLPGGWVPREDGAPHLPLHDVELAPFFLSRYEMTEAQGLRFGGNWWSRFSGADSPLKVIALDVMSWRDCTACLALAGGGLHLPTAAQWEYACRADRTTPDWRGILEYLRSAILRFDAAVPRAVEGVGSRVGNPFGLHDMIGNVAEWCSDGTDDRAAPRDGDGLRLSARSLGRWLRGGDADTLPADVAVGYVAGEDFDKTNHRSDRDGDGDNDFHGGQHETWRPLGGMRPARPLMQ